MRVRSKYYAERPLEILCDHCKAIVEVKPVGRVPRYCSDAHQKVGWKESQ